MRRFGRRGVQVALVVGVAALAVAAASGFTSGGSSTSLSKGTIKVGYGNNLTGFLAVHDKLISNGAKDTDVVYAYINEAFSLEAQAQEAQTLVQAAVCPGAVKLMDKATRALYPYGQLTQILTKAAPLEVIPANVPKGYATFDDWNKAWEKFKA